MKKYYLLTHTVLLIFLLLSTPTSAYKVINNQTTYLKKPAISMNFTAGKKNLLRITKVLNSSTIVVDEPSNPVLQSILIENERIVFHRSIMLLKIDKNNYIVIEPFFDYCKCFKYDNNEKIPFNIKSKYLVKKQSKSVYIFHVCIQNEKDNFQKIADYNLTCWSEFKSENINEKGLYTGADLSVTCPLTLLINGQYRNYVLSQLVLYLTGAEIERLQ